MRRALALIIALTIPTNAHANRLWSSGYELNSTTAATEWTSFVGVASIVSTNTHSGAYVQRSSSGGAATGYAEFQTVTMATGDVWSFRTYLYVDNYPDTVTGILQIIDSASGGCWGAWMTTTGEIQLRFRATSCASSTGTQVGSDSSTVPTGEWHYVEVQGNWDTNACSARLDGSSFASGTCTNAIAATSFRIGIGADGTTVANTDIRFDDVAFNDDNGSSQTSWPGAGFINYLRPNGDGDADTAVTLVSCASAQACTNEVTPDDVTTHVRLTANPSLVIMAMDDAGTNPDSNDTITLIQVGLRGRTGNDCTIGTTGAGNWTAKLVSGASTSTGSSIGVNTATWSTNGDGAATAEKYYGLTAYVDPATSAAWTLTGLNAAQIGAGTTDGNPDSCITSIWGLVEYNIVANPPAGGCSPTMTLLGVSRCGN